LARRGDGAERAKKRGELKVKLTKWLEGEWSRENGRTGDRVDHLARWGKTRQED
jgi:hypothetical protein